MDAEVWGWSGGLQPYNLISGTGPSIVMKRRNNHQILASLTFSSSRAKLGLREKPNSKVHCL